MSAAERYPLKLPGNPTTEIHRYALATVLYALLALPGHLRPFAFAAAWTAYEYLKSIGYLGYPWGLAGHTLGGVVPLLQIADIAGAYGVTFLVVYANAAIAEVLLGTRRSDMPVRHLLFAALLFAGVYGYGQVRMRQLPPPADSIRALLVQQNTDSWAPGGLAEALVTLQHLSSEALERQPADLLIWSESSLTLPYGEERDGYYRRTPSEQPLTDFIAALDFPLLTGSPYRPSGGAGSRNENERAAGPEPAEAGAGRPWNAVLLIEPGSGDIVERYGKRQLVPFAEHVPFGDSPAVRRFFEEVVGIGAVWAPADETVLFEVPTRGGTALAGAPISFEASFAPLIRDFAVEGADLIINLTNNSWSQTESAQYQQFIGSRFRAIEARRPLLASTISGLTGAVDITGELIARAPMFEATALAVEAPIYDRAPLTVYHAIGDLFAWVMLAVAGLLIVPAARELAHARTVPSDGA